MTARKRIDLTRNAMRRAQSRTRRIIAEQEATRAHLAALTGAEVPGVDERDYLAVLADELTRQPLPNRAERRAAKRR